MCDGAVNLDGVHVVVVLRVTDAVMCAAGCDATVRVCGGGSVVCKPTVMVLIVCVRTVVVVVMHV